MTWSFQWLTLKWRIQERTNSTIVDKDFHMVSVLKLVFSKKFPSILFFDIITTCEWLVLYHQNIYLVHFTMPSGSLDPSFINWMQVTWYIPFKPCNCMLWAFMYWNISAGCMKFKDISNTHHNNVALVLSQYFCLDYSGSSQSPVCSTSSHSAQDLNADAMALHDE